MRVMDERDIGDMGSPLSMVCMLLVYCFSGGCQGFSPKLDDMEFLGDFFGVAAAFDAELLEDVDDMRFDGGDLDTENVGDLLGGKPPADAHQNIPLAPPPRPAPPLTVRAQVKMKTEIPS